jgi:hypothetical protein
MGIGGLEERVVGIRKNFGWGGRWGWKNWGGGGQGEGETCKEGWGTVYVEKGEFEKVSLFTTASLKCGF